MHSFKCVAALSALLSAVAAVPMKRELIVNTVTEVEIVTEILTATVWVDASDAATTTSQPPQYTHWPHDAHTSAAWWTTHAAPTTSSSIYIAPSTSSSTSSIATTSTSTTPYVAPVPTTSVYVAPAPPTTTSTSQYIAPTSTYVAPIVTSPTSTYVAPVETPTSTYVAPAYTPPAYTSTTSTIAAAAAATGSSSGAQTHTGEITYYDVGLGSCGYTNTDSESVVAMAVGLMDKATMCGKTVTISYGGVTKTAQVVDTCMGCANGNLDMSPTLFEAFAPLASGRVGGVQWSFN